MANIRTSVKLNVLLAKTEHSASQWKGMITNYLGFFKGNQGAFKGIKKTYAPKPDTMDLPSERANIQVATTVKEKFDWFEETGSDHINNLFSVEATNASGSAKAQLVCDGVDFGNLSSLELLRLLSLLEAGELEQMYQHIPVRSDTEVWAASGAEQYQGRLIFETPQLIGTKKSITKESYILADPNLASLRDGSKYTPIQGVKDTLLELGDYTIQHFSGETTQREKAEILRRRSKLIGAVKEALKVANEAESVASPLTARKIFGFLHRGAV